jgi:ribosomal protein S18 acetylase RimI-like enzyme
MLRPITPNDAAAVAGLVRAAFAVQSVPTDPPASALRLTAMDVGVHLAAGGGGMVVEEEGVIVASIMWSQEDRRFYIARLAVAPAWRRRGHARALLAVAEVAARAAGLSRLHLGTRLALLDNRRLFAEAGFVEVARHAHPGYAESTWVAMEKRLIP